MLTGAVRVLWNNNLRMKRVEWETGYERVERERSKVQRVELERVELEWIELILV